MSFTIDSTSWRTPNYWRDHNGNPSMMQPRMIVCHTGEGNSAFSDLSWLCFTGSGVSAHYYIKRDGTIYQLADDHRVCWHAAEFNWVSIGIEAEHKQGQDWPPIQREAYAWLVDRLIQKYDIPQHNVRAHRWISPANRSDPTDWPDSELNTWIASLYQPRLERPYSRRPYRVLIDGLRVRAGPTTSHDVITTLNRTDASGKTTYVDGAFLTPGTKVAIGDRVTDVWVYDRNTEGYVTTAYLELKIRRFQLPEVRNLRDRPNTQSAILGQAQQPVEIAEVVAGEAVDGANDKWGRLPQSDNYVYLAGATELTQW